MPISFLVPQPSDEHLIQIFEQLKNLAISNHFETTGDFAVGGISFGGLSAINSVVGIDDKSELIFRINHTYSKPHNPTYGQQCYISISFQRYYQANNNLTSPFFARIELSEGGIGESEKLLYSQIINVLQSLRSRIAIEKESSFDDIKEAATSSFVDLRDLHARLISSAADLASTLQKDASEVRKSMEQELSKKKTELDSIKEKIEAEHAETMATLEERSKSLDDRSHMHVRRELRERISSSLRERLLRPNIPKSVSYIRIWISLVCFVGLIVSGFISVSSVTEISNILTGLGNQDIKMSMQTILIATAAKGALSSIVFVTILFYFLNWLRRIHDGDVRVERDLERYRYDLDRATWAIETVLEIQNRDGGTVPDTWLDSVTRSMFARGPDRSHDGEPLDALGQLLNMTAEAEIGVQGTKFRFGRRDLKNIARSAQNEEA
jgi:hypothetical protein